MKTTIIVAYDLDRGIGKDNDLMWHLPSDMKFFKETTQNHIVVMGRKNYESIPAKFRPLPKRENVVLSRQKNLEFPNCLVFSSLESCLENYREEKDRTIFIIGGGQIYEEAIRLNVVKEMYVTKVNYKFDADTFFPEIKESEWEISSIMKYYKDEKNKFEFEVFRYKKLIV